MEYGSLVNHIVGNSFENWDPNDPKLMVGVWCTELCYSDRHPWVVVEVNRDKNGTVKSMVVQACKAEADKTKNPRVGHQDWIITKNPDGAKVTLKWRKSRKGWYAKGYDGKGWHNRFAMGYAEEYYDWSF